MWRYVNEVLATNVQRNTVDKKKLIEKTVELAHKFENIAEKTIPGEQP